MGQGHLVTERNSLLVVALIRVCDRCCRGRCCGGCAVGAFGGGGHPPGRSKTFYVRAAVRAYLADVEERYWAEGVIDRWEASDQVSRPAVVLWAGLDA